MHLCDDATARESLPPDLCVDLSQCTLRWISKASASGKRKNVVEVKSPLLGIEMNLHFDQHSGAAGWFPYAWRSSLPYDTKHINMQHPRSLFPYYLST